MTSSPASRLILVGRVAGAFGVRGEVRIATYTADPMAVLAYKRLLREDGALGLTLTSARPTKDGVVARAPEIETKEQADALKGLRLYVPRDALPEPEEDEFYLTDLIGLPVFTEAGEALGRVKAVPNFGAGDLLEIDPGQGRATFHLPFTRDVVPTVDLSGGRIVAVPPSETEARDDA